LSVSHLTISGNTDMSNGSTAATTIMRIVVAARTVSLQIRAGSRTHHVLQIRER
jgi:hypothetical protein